MRLPTSLLSIIEAHLPLKTFPPQTLTTILNPANWPPRSTLLSPSPSHPPQSAQPPAQTVRYRLYMPSLRRSLRLSPRDTSASLSKAHAYLNDYSPEAGIPKERVYSAMIAAFLSHPLGLPAARSLLTRQLAESLSPSIHSLTQILQLSLSTSTPLLPLLQRMLPLLPNTLDIPLLTLILRSLIREMAPEPAEIEKIIVECLKLDKRGEKAKWPWDMWDVLLYAHARRGDLRSALPVLGEFKSIVLASGAHSRHFKEREAITRIYVTMMSLWTSSRFRPDGRKAFRVGSSIPRSLARDLVELLGQDVGRLNLAFLNVWMNAERVAENYEAAWSIWDLIACGTEPKPDMERPPFPLVSSPQQTRARSYRPDQTTFIALFKLLKAPTPHPHLSPRQATALLLTTKIDLSAPLLNAILSKILHPTSLDLPLLLLILRGFGVRSVLPTTRTIDMIAAGLLRAWRRGRLGNLFGDAPRGNTNLTSEDWNLVSKKLHSLRADSTTLALSTDENTPPSTTPSNPKVETHRLLYPAPPVTGGAESGVGLAKTKHLGEMVKPLILLVVRAIVLSAPREDLKEEDEVWKNTVLREVMGKVNEEVLPKKKGPIA